MHEPPLLRPRIRPFLSASGKPDAPGLETGGIVGRHADRYCKTTAVGLSCHSCVLIKATRVSLHQWRQECSRSSRKEMCTPPSQGERGTFSLSDGSSPSWPNRFKLSGDFEVQVISARDKLVLPGFVDLHVHLLGGAARAASGRGRLISPFHPSPSPGYDSRRLPRHRRRLPAPGNPPCQGQPARGGGSVGIHLYRVLSAPSSHHHRECSKDVALIPKVIG